MSLIATVLHLQDKRLLGHFLVVQSRPVGRGPFTRSTPQRRRVWINPLSLVNQQRFYPFCLVQLPALHVQREERGYSDSYRHFVRIRELTQRRLGATHLNCCRRVHCSRRLAIGLPST